MIRSFGKYFMLAGLFLAGCKKDDVPSHAPGAPMTISEFMPAQGGGGTSVLINGSNFTSDTSELEVTINGNKLAIIGANTNQIMAVVPKKCGTGNIVVKVGGDEIASTAVFNYMFTRNVTTFAGNGTAGFANGKGEEAQFNFNKEAWYRSKGIVTDDEGNVFVADPGNHCIRKITPEGDVTVFSGNPNAAGHADGQGLTAQFSLPYDLTIDNDQNLYCVDPGNWDIRKISPDGTALTIGWATGEPWSVAYDKSSNTLYYLSAANGNVYKVAPDGSSEAVITGINSPAGMGFDAQGNLYVASNGDHTILKFEKGSSTGIAIAGAAGASGYVNGTGADARFAFPWGLCIDAAGNIYVAGNGTWDGGTYNPDQSIRFIDAKNGEVSTYAGSGTAGYANAIGEAAAFSAPGGVAVDRNGIVYVLDKNNNRVRRIISE
ncbi:IPT/TIG domain-containing protein [Chitinophaga cymbidii]|nr:IPT/TIG domain-containing protein [Chitinophaga cymbidii]